MTSDHRSANKSVVIVGASARAMAESAHRAGWRVSTIDLFGDEDLQKIADVIHVVPFDEYPSAISSLIQGYQGTPICYTGGIENSGDVIDQLSLAGPLWGNSSNIVARVRDIFELFPLLRSRQFRCPAIRQKAMEADRGKCWLKKSIRSAGGLQVEFWDGSDIGPGEYLQEFVAGHSRSTLFVGTNGTAELLGSSRQLLLRDGDHSEFARRRPFQYAGSIGPIRLSPQTVHRLTTLGNFLADRFRLCGAFGVDWIDQDGEIYVIEVNPRYPASSEVIEPSLHEPVFFHHARAFHWCQHLTQNSTRAIALQQVTGKYILFAPRPGVISSNAPCYQPAERDFWFADIPRKGTRIAEGFPILTILARDESEEVVQGRLMAQGHDFIEQFFRSDGGELGS